MTIESAVLFRARQYPDGDHAIDDQVAHFFRAFGCKHMGDLDPDLGARFATSCSGYYFACLRKFGLRFSFSAFTPSRDSSVS